jgi:hypothetical protein
MAKPFVTAAMFCEKVLQEKDDIISVMRVVDRLQYGVELVPTESIKQPELPEPIKPVIPIQGLISVRSGPMSSDYTIRLVMERPNKERRDILSVPVKFVSPDVGQNIILNMGIAVNEDGLYWMDVFCGEDLLTRVPLMITRRDERQSQV